MLLNNQNMGKDGHQLSLVGDVVSHAGSPMQIASPGLPRGDTDMLIKKIAQLQQRQSSSQQQQLQQHALSSQQSKNSNHHHPQDKSAGGNNIIADGSMSNSFRGNEASKSQNGRKGKQHMSSSGPANSTGTTNTAGPSPSSAPSTPSTHTPGDVMSMPTLPHDSGSSKPLAVLGDGTGTLTSPSNPLWDDNDLDGSLDDNIESFIATDDNDPRDARGMDVCKG